MSIGLNIAIFAGFVIIFLAWVVASEIFGVLLKTRPSVGESWWFVGLFSLVNTLIIFVLVWVLSGFWNWILVATCLVVSYIGVAVSLLARELLGSTDPLTQTRVLAAGVEWDTKHPTFNGKVLRAIILSASLAYLLVCGILYFTQEPSPVRTVALLQAALAFFFVVGLAVLMPLRASLVAGKNLDMEARNRIFTGQLGELVINALYLSLIFLSFGTVTEGAFFDVAKSVSRELAAKVTIATVVLFLLAVLLPHLVGNRRSQVWRVDLLKRKKQVLAILLDILATPLPATYVERLTELRETVRALVTQFKAKENDLTFDLMAAIEDSANKHNELTAAESALLQSRDGDPRFRHCDWLAALADGQHQGISLVIDDLDQKATDTDRKKAAEDWHKRFTQMRTDLDDEHKSDAERAALLPGFALWIVGATVPAFVSFVAITAWQLVIAPGVTK